MVNCISCGKELVEIIDTTSCNHNTQRVSKGQHTGDIYSCDECEVHTIDDFVDSVVRQWDY